MSEEGNVLNSWTTHGPDKPRDAFHIKPKEDYKIIHWLGAVPIRKIIFIGKESDSSSTGKKNKQRE